METKQQYVLITGASSGIGLELAKVFAQNGYNLVITARHQKDLDAVAEQLSAHNVHVISIPMDLFDYTGAKDLYNEISRNEIQIDILVNNAGQGQYGKFADTNINRELDIIQLNIMSLVILTKFFLIDMLKRGEGKILNVASIASKVPGPYQAVYHATKAFVHSFTEAVRSEVADTGVTLTSLLPGATETDFFNKADMLNSKAIKDKELADPAEVAKDGFDALMSGKDMVISGLKNKMQMAMSNVIPDDMLAAQMKKQQEPADKPEE
jgi:hypothetical protein